MTNNVIIYVVNVNEVVNNLNELYAAVSGTNKYRVSAIDHLPKLKNVAPGDIITTKKGNKAYVIDVFTDFNDPRLVDFCDSHEVKESKILGVSNLTTRKVWDKSYAPVAKAAPVAKMSIADKVKSMFMPTEAENVAISMNGDICVATNEGYVTINSENELVSYPEELVLTGMPAYVVSKPIDQVVAGDIIQVKNSYVKVVGRRGNKLTTISYTGSGKTVHTIKDVILNQNLVRVVITLTGSVNSQVNPLMFMMLAKDGNTSDKLLPLMMMNQQNGALGTNPMLMALAMGDGELDTKSLLMMSMMGGQNILGNMFGTKTPSNIKQTYDLEDVDAEDVKEENVKD